MKLNKDVCWIGLIINHGIPIDKIIVFPLLYFQLDKLNRQKRKRYGNNFTIICFICLLGFIFNSQHNFLILYPLLFLLLAVISCDNSNYHAEYKYIKLGILLNTIYGLFSVVLNLIGIDIGGSISLLGRGFEFLKGPSGFSPTLQVYGTLSVTWLFFDFLQHKRLRWLSILFILSVILTINRASFILLFLFFLYIRPKSAFLILLTIIIFLLLNTDLYNTLTSNSTLQSRSELRYGAYLSWWTSTDPLVIFLGKGTHLTSEAIAKKTIWERTYIENGLDFLLHSYGIIGLMVYIIFIGKLIYMAFKKHLYRFSIVIIYYYLIEQVFTNEFLSSSFCIVTIMILSTIHQFHKNEKPTFIHPSVC